MGVEPKLMVPPNHPLKNRVGTMKFSPSILGGKTTPIFGFNTHMQVVVSMLVGETDIFGLEPPAIHTLYTFNDVLKFFTSREKKTSSILYILQISRKLNWVVVSNIFIFIPIWGNDPV